ncbi:MAG TPA: hypothetical protein ENJ15_04045 [Caldithrix abyssi]|uniref:VWA domain-containing protein n=1 Tax=Caldithrix abyssi TaxID=187145 RepID=A0A7V5RPD4_CALAY|nr:hypothetical protein [Caldithrix abyssi]
MPDLIQLNIPFFFVFMLFALGMLTAFFFYRKSYPPLSPMRRYLLVLIRGSWLAGLLLLLTGPVLKLHYSEERPRNVAVFVDHSASMGLVNRFENRRDSLEAARTLLAEYLAERDTRFVWFSFNQQVKNYDEQDTLYTGLTDFAPLVKSAREAGADNIFILSDGIRTAGGGAVPPGVPVYTIGLGGIKEFPDLFIRRVRYEPEVVQNDTARLSIIVGQKGLEKQAVTVALFRGRERIGQKRMFTAAGGGDRELRFEYIPRKKGFQKYRVEVRGDADEQNMRNNSYRFTQWVRKSKIRIGLFASAPSYDFKFIRRAIDGGRNLRAEIYLPGVKLSSRLPADSLDAAFLIGLPARGITTSYQRGLDKLDDLKGGKVFYLTSTSDADALSAMLGPDVTISTTANRVEGQIEVTEPLHPLMAVFPDMQKSRGFWQKSAPVLSGFKVGTAEPFAVINQERNSAFLARPAPNIFLVNGEGFWRTAFDPGENDLLIREGYNRFFQGLAFRAAARGTEKAVRLQTDKRVYNIGESIRLSAYVYDSRQSEIGNAVVEVSVSLGDQNFNFNLSPAAGGGYQAAFPAVEEGLYTFNATARREGTVLGRESISVRVQAPDAEFTHTRQDTAFFRNWAAKSGGAYLSLEELRRGRRLPPLEPVTVERRRETDLKNSMIMLTALLLLISMEWILRKRFNLI